MKITEWFARAVTAGLMPEWKNITASTSCSGTVNIWNEDATECIHVPVAEQFVGVIRLRKDSKDLYSLEWRKPTEGDVGKMCWFYSNRNHKDKTVYCAELFEFQNEFNVMGTKFIYYLAGEYARPEKYCLLADHNQIAPTEQDFKRIYGEII